MREEEGCFLQTGLESPAQPDTHVRMTPQCQHQVRVVSGEAGRPVWPGGGGGQVLSISALKEESLASCLVPCSASCSVLGGPIVTPASHRQILFVALVRSGKSSIGRVCGGAGLSCSLYSRLDSLQTVTQ